MAPLTAAVPPPGGDATASLIGVAWLILELAALFLIVAGGVALTTRRLGLDRMRRLLGGTRLVGALKGVVLGFVTPFCTYSAIPALVAMFDTGVRTAAWVGFLLAAPVLDPLLAVALAVIFDPGVALAYTAITGTGVVAAAVLADIAGVRPRTGTSTRRRATAAPAPSVAADPCAVASRPDPMADRAPWRGWPAEARHAAAYATYLLRDMAVPVGIAAVAAVVIVGVVPEDLLVAVAGPGSPLAVPAAALIGAPFYVSGEAFLPIAAALRQQGMGDGALIALIISGTGVNLPELTVLSRLLEPRLLVALVAAVFMIACVAGVIIPTIA